MSGKIMIGGTSGMRGMFPVMYDDDGPIMTGFTCKDHEELKREAIAWAKSEFGDNWEIHCEYKDY